MDHLTKYLRKPVACEQAAISERGELLLWIRNTVNACNKRDGYSEKKIAYYAKLCQGIPTKDLGRDLYALKALMEDSKNPGAAFHVGAKRLRGEDSDEILKASSKDV